MAREDPFIQIDGVTFQYEKGNRLLRDISARFGRTSATLLSGQNGAGKSTIVKLLMGLLVPDSGSIRVGGSTAHETPLHEMAQRVGVSLQTAEHHLFSPTVRKEIAYGPANLSRPNTEELVDDALGLFSLGEFSARHPYDLHPSRRKLLSLASVVAMDTPFLIFDEPTAGLSSPEKAILSSVMNTLRTRGKGYILITHDMQFGFEHCDRLIILRDGRLATDGSIGEFLGRPDAEGVMRKAGARMPSSPRLSRLLGQQPPAKSLNDFLTLFKDTRDGH